MTSNPVNDQQLDQTCIFFKHMCYNLLSSSNLNLLESFCIYFVEMDAIVQVVFQELIKKKSENPANQDEVLTVDFNFLNVKLSKQKKKKK